jgi:Flp pilus assembly pilin Flp
MVFRLLKGVSQGRDVLLDTKVSPQRGNMKILNKDGQTLIEYALVAGVVAAALVAMSTYVNRSVQATQQKIQVEASLD